MTYERRLRRRVDGGIVRWDRVRPQSEIPDEPHDTAPVVRVAQDPPIPLVTTVAEMLRAGVDLRTACFTVGSTVWQLRKNATHRVEMRGRWRRNVALEDAQLILAQKVVKKNPVTTSQRRDEVTHLRAQGMDLPEIARTLGVKLHTLQRSIQRDYERKRSHSE